MSEFPLSLIFRFGEPETRAASAELVQIARILDKDVAVLDSFNLFKRINKKSSLFAFVNLKKKQLYFKIIIHHISLPHSKNR